MTCVPFESSVVRRAVRETPGGRRALGNTTSTSTSTTITSPTTTNPSPTHTHTHTHARTHARTQHTPRRSRGKKKQKTTTHFFCRSLFLSPFSHLPPVVSRRLSRFHRTPSPPAWHSFDTRFRRWTASGCSHPTRPRRTSPRRTSSMSWRRFTSEKWRRAPAPQTPPLASPSSQRRGR